MRNSAIRVFNARYLIEAKRAGSQFIDEAAGCRAEPAASPDGL